MGMARAVRAMSMGIGRDPREWSDNSIGSGADGINAQVAGTAEAASRRRARTEKIRHEARDRGGRGRPPAAGRARGPCRILRLGTYGMLSIAEIAPPAAARPAYWPPWYLAHHPPPPPT